MWVIFTMDPDYRYYNCNIQCPKLKSNTFQTDSFESASLSPSNIQCENGYGGPSLTFDIAPAALQASNSTGELTVYLKNELAPTIAVIMIVVSKSGGVITQALPYQTVSTFTTATVSIPNNTSIRITMYPAGKVQWIWQGI
jgi:hypothetical protein